MRYGFPSSPWAHPHGCPKYFWNERCLQAPKPYLEDGFYALAPRRRVRPGLLPAPKGFASIPDTSLLVQALKSLMSHIPNTNDAVKQLLENQNALPAIYTDTAFRRRWGCW